MSVRKAQDRPQVPSAAGPGPQTHGQGHEELFLAPASPTLQGSPLETCAGVSRRADALWEKKPFRGTVLFKCSRCALATGAPVFLIFCVVLQFSADSVPKCWNSLPASTAFDGFSLGSQELEAIKARVREMEEEAEKLKELQNEVEKQMNMSPPPGASLPGASRVWRSD